MAIAPTPKIASSHKLSLMPPLGLANTRMYAVMMLVANGAILCSNFCVMTIKVLHKRPLTSFCAACSV